MVPRPRAVIGKIIASDSRSDSENFLRDRCWVGDLFLKSTCHYFGMFDQGCFNAGDSQNSRPPLHPLASLF